MKDEAKMVARGAMEMRQKAPYSPERRRFLEIMCVGLGGIAAALISIPVIGVLLSPQIKAPSGVWRRLGRVDDFKEGHTVEATYLNANALPWGGDANRNAVWLHRFNGGGFLALSIYCQHLGCPVRWEAGAKLFFCPCHGGVYYEDGTVAAGPPPRALQQFPVRVRNGQVEVFTAPIPVTY